MSAVILPHRSAPVTFDPPPTSPWFEELTEDQIATLDACDVLERLAERVGSFARVARILRTVATIHGEDI